MPENNQVNFRDDIFICISHYLLMLGFDDI